MIVNGKHFSQVIPARMSIFRNIEDFT